MKKVIFLLAFLCAGLLYSQKIMTPELLWQVKRVSPIGISDDSKVIFYKVTTPNMEENSFDSKYYAMRVEGGNFAEITKDEVQVADKNLSPDRSEERRVGKECRSRWSWDSEQKDI